MTAPKPQNMKVIDRWKLLANNGTFHSVLADPEIIELPEELFGEIPGTREFLNTVVSNK